MRPDRRALPSADDLKTAGDPTGRFDPPASTIHVGIIRGGTARNILAKECVFEWEFRGLPGVDYKHGSRPYERADRAHRPPRKPRTRQSAPVSRRRRIILCRGSIPSRDHWPKIWGLKLARRNATITVSYASEAGQFQAAGIPTIICGPGSIDQAHQPDEYIEIDQLAAGVKFMRRLAAELS